MTKKTWCMKCRTRHLTTTPHDDAAPAAPGSWWWPRDARTHRDRLRCGNCGHATAYHAPTTRGRETGACRATNPSGGACGCKACVKPGTARTKDVRS